MTFKGGPYHATALTCIYLGVIIFEDHFKVLVLYRTCFKTDFSRQMMPHIFISSFMAISVTYTEQCDCFRLRQNWVQILLVLHVSYKDVEEFFNLFKTQFSLECNGGNFNLFSGLRGMMNTNHLFLKDFIYLFLERGEWREKERERNMDWLPLISALSGD